ncbi:MAG: type II toxin-antitoxin system RelB/DinJ family antitoxin [Firmicutes bacterium]|nr:type II toxin-antitoxin system RelB/DinJ family antitoxin [Candidatus Colivicinus equi]
MAKVSTNINLDPELKKQGQLLFSSLGMDLTTAVTIFIKQAVREQKIPFEITMHRPNIETISALNEYEQMKADKEAYKRYDTIDDALDEALLCTK